MKKVLIVFAMTSLLSMSAIAFPGPDSIGIYSSTSTATTTLTTTSAFEQVTLFLMITNSSAGGVSGWECEVVIDGTVTAASWTHAGGGLNVFDPVATGLFNVGVGVSPDALLPNVDNAIVLATFSAFIMTTSDRVAFSINGFPESVTFTSGHPGYVNPENVGIIHELTVNTGATRGPGTLHDVELGNVCFIVNPVSGDVIVSNSDRTWSNVKALYR